MKRLLCLVLALLLPLCAAMPALAEGNMLSMQLTHVDAQDMRLGQCMAPQGYTVLAGVNICAANQSVQSPLCLDVIAISPDQRSNLSYESASTFIEIKSSTDSGRTLYTHEDGKIHPSTMTPMLRYMQPQAYCETFARGVLQGANISAELNYVGQIDLTDNNDTLQKLADAHYKSLVGDGTAEQLGLHIDGVAYTMGECCYSFDNNGQTYYIVVAVMLEATQMTMSMPSVMGGTLSETDIVWGPLYTYGLVAPEEDVMTLYPDAFHLFMENTTASDQFILANLQLSQELTQIIVNGRIESAQSYATQVLSKAAGSGETYDDDRFTDYIFDQNDYSLSDGSRVKVSTAYDYVYEGDNGIVYYTNDALAEPQGARRLTPNR